MKLFIICGHGNGDPGACSDGYSEADLVRQLAARIKARGGAEVEVGDTSRNWYAENLISQGKCPSGVPVVELHMDSAAASAKGGHVIIKSGFEADSYDLALEKFIKGFFPGRSVTLDKRSDLANPNRAGKMGVNYRLVENGFISNDGDRQKFIDHMDALADGYLAAFGIKGGSGSSGASTSGSSKPSTGGSSSAKKTVSQLADEVIAGKWGNGSARKAKLEAAGYDYSAVQAEVNRKLGVSTGSGSSSGSSSSGSIKVGSTVRVTNPVDYNGTHLAVSGTYTVMEVKGDRIVIGRGGVVTAAISRANLAKA